MRSQGRPERLLPALAPFCSGNALRGREAAAQSGGSDGGRTLLVAHHIQAKLTISYLLTTTATKVTKCPSPTSAAIPLSVFMDLKEGETRDEEQQQLSGAQVDKWRSSNADSKLPAATTIPLALLSAASLLLLLPRPCKRMDTLIKL